MNNWEHTTLGAELELEYGRGLAAGERVPGVIPVFGSNGLVGTHYASLVSGPGIVIGRKGSVGAVTYSKTSFWPIDTAYFVKNVNGHDWRFLYHWLRWLRLDQLNSHSAVPGLSRESVYSLQGKLPGRVEQAAIARVLDSVECAIEATDAIVSTIHEVKQATAHQLFTRGLHDEPQRSTDIGPIPRSWDIVQLGDVARIGNGSTPKRSRTDYWTDGTVPWLNSGKIHEGVIRKAEQFVTETALSECHLPIVPADSLLIAITGQGKTLGNVALTSIATTVNQHLAYVTFHDERVSAGFARHYLASRYEELRTLGQGGGSTKGAITCAALRGVSLPLPPHNDQQPIAAALDAADLCMAAHRRRKELLQELFDSLLHETMTGSIDVANLTACATEA